MAKIHHHQNYPSGTQANVYDHNSSSPYKNGKINSDNKISFVEFDSSNALIRTILEEIDMITGKLDRRADQIINTYSPGKVKSRLRAMSPEIKNLRRRTIDLIKDGESVLNRMSRFDTDDRSKYSVKDWMKNLNNENDLRRVLIDLRNKLRSHMEFLQSYYPPTMIEHNQYN